MRVCYEIATKRIIEVQSGGSTPAHLQTLIDNAISAGWDKSKITCEFMDDIQYTSAQAADPFLAAEKAAAKAKEDTVKAAKVDLIALRATQDADPSKVKITDLLTRIQKIETILEL